MMETALTDTEVMERISARLQQTDKSLWGKIKKFLQGLVERLKEAYRGLNPDSSIARLARDTIRSSEEALNAFADAASDAVVNYRLQDGQKNNAPEGERFSTRENKQAVAEMETVVSVPGYHGSLKASDVIQTVSDFFSSIGNAAENEELGSVILRKRGIKDDISHGIGREKVAAFMAVPDVLKHGKVVDYRENWKGRGYDTAVVAAPIKISGEDYIAGVCVKRASGESRFYVHEVLSIKEGATPFNRAALKTSVDSGGDTPSMNNILSELLHVKGISRFPSRNNPDIRFSQRISAEERVERMETEIQYLKKLVQIQRMGKVV